MYLDALFCENFRNYKSALLTNLMPRNILVGVNGSGKSNLLEAIYFLSYASPMRPVQLQDLPTWDTGNAFQIQGKNSTHKTSVYFKDGKKSLFLDQKKIPLRELMHHNPVLAFLPEDIRLLNGAPERKRSFMNQVLVMTDPEYPLYLERYDKALRQKNHQLRNNIPKSDIWNAELSHSGAYVLQKRMRLMRHLASYLTPRFESLYHVHVDLMYLNNFPIHGSVEAALLEALQQSRPKELARRVTLIGPHRDNFEIHSQHLHSKVFASQGQVRCLSILLKLAALDFIEQHKQEKAIILLDDVLLELDPERRFQLLSDIQKGRQSFSTATHLEVLPKQFQETAVFEIIRGQVFRRN